MKQRSEIEFGAEVEGGGAQHRGIQRLMLIGLFVVAIATTLAFGIAALNILSARATQVNGPASPVPEILDRIAHLLDELAVDDHAVSGGPEASQVSTAERLAPLLERFQEQRQRWLRFSESELAVDVLLSRRLTRQLEVFEGRLAAVAGPLATAPEPSVEAYNRLQRQAYDLGALLDETRRAQLEAARLHHAGDMREVHRATRNFVYLGGLTLIGFVVLSVVYLAQMRRHDRNLDALNRLSALLSTHTGIPLFEAMVTFLGEELGHAYVFIGKLAQASPPQVDTVAVFAHGKLAGNISYRLQGTPCENVIQRVPADGAAPSPLVSGQTYYLAVMRDLAQPITRCTFTAP